MVKKLWQLCMLICVTWSGWAEAGLTVKADKKITVLGEPLLVQVKADDVREPLSSINLDKLKRNFNIFGISTSAQAQSKNGRRAATATMTLTLYPLRKGRLELPALSYRGKNSLPLLVSVLESSKQASLVIFKTALDAAHSQVRQAATLTLEIYDDGSLQWTAPRELVAAGAHQRRLAESQREELMDGTRYTVHRYAWALMPLREGKMAVEFPMLDAFKFGIRLRYAVAPFRMDAAAVPAYLPVHVPIGKPVISAESLPDKIALDRPVNRVFIVQGSGVSEEGLGKLLSTLRSNEALRFYPNKISNAGNERATSAMQTLLVTIPFVPLRTGTLQLPEINIPYYDPASARVESVFIPGASVEVFNPLWQAVQKVAVGLLVLLSVIGLAYLLFKQLRHAVKRRKSLLAVSSAASAEELHLALLNFDTETALQQCVTLQQWLQRRQMVYGVDERLADIVQKLESAQYGADATDMEITGFACEAADLLKKLPDRKVLKMGV